MTNAEHDSLTIPKHSFRTIKEIRNVHKKHKDNLVELGGLCAVVALLSMADVIGSPNSISPVFAIILGGFFMMAWCAARTRISNIDKDTLK